MSARRAVVVGGGITGILVARRLLLGGWGVTVLESAQIGSGSSSRTAAGIRQQFSTVGTVLGMRHAVRAYDALSEELGERCIVHQGYLFLTDTEAGWEAARARVATQQAAGLHDVEALDHDVLCARFPHLDPDTVRGGTFCPSDGFLLPTVIYQEGARRVRELGGTILQKAPVTAGHHRDGRLVGVDTPKGRVEGDLFLDCTNAWSPRVAERLGGVRLPVDPIKRYLWFVQRDGGMSGEALMRLPMTISPSGVYGRPENPDTLLMGWAKGGQPQPGFARHDQDTIDPEHAHDAGIDAVPFEAWGELATVVPAIGEFAGVMATTAGFYGVTPDHNPFLGYDPEVPNLVHLVGFSGHGVMFGPFTAEVALALADAGRDVDTVALPTGDVSLHEFAIGRTFGRGETMVI